jgi:hypothetical protein
LPPGHPGTNTDASVDFLINAKEYSTPTLHIEASDPKLAQGNTFVVFDAIETGQEGQDTMLIQSHGEVDQYQGLIIDSIALHDWII